MAKLEKCPHRCQSMCHPGKECPEVECDAEMRHYCKCGHRYVLTVCKSLAEREPLACNADCWKRQRNKRLASAFGGSGSAVEETKAAMEKEYYPEEAVEFATQLPKFA